MLKPNNKFLGKTILLYVIIYKFAMQDKIRTYTS